MNRSEAVRELPPQPITLPLRDYVGRLKTIDVRIGSETHAFLFDTAAGETLLTPETAARLGCTPSGRTVDFRMTGERVEFQQCTGMALDFGGLVVEHPQIGVFDLMALLPQGLPPLAGIVSLKSFESQVLTLDWRCQCVVLESEESARERRRAMSPVPARFATGPSGVSLVAFLAFQAGPHRVWLELDSGNLDRVLLAPHAARLLGLSLDGVPASSAAGMTSPVPRWDLPEAALRFPGQEPDLLPVGVRDLIHDGALGISFIERWRFTLDLRNGQVWVARQPPGDSPPASE